MPVVTESDIAEGFQVLFKDFGLLEYVPGGLWYGSTPQEKPDPYAKLEVTEGEPQHNSGSTYLHVFTVTLSVWTRTGATETGKTKAAIGQLFNRERIAAKLTVPNADRVVDVRPLAPAGGGLEEEASYQEQVPVMVTRRTFEVMVQVTRE